MILVIALKLAVRIPKYREKSSKILETLKNRYIWSGTIRSFTLTYSQTLMGVCIQSKMLIAGYSESRATMMV